MWSPERRFFNDPVLGISRVDVQLLWNVVLQRIHTRLCPSYDSWFQPFKFWFTTTICPNLALPRHIFPYPIPASVFLESIWSRLVEVIRTSCGISELGVRYREVY